MAISNSARDAPNVLFDAALEFGTNWRRDIGNLAQERLRTIGADKRAELSAEVKLARNSIEDWIRDRWDALQGNWTKADAEAAREYIRATAFVGQYGIVLFYRGA